MKGNLAVIAAKFGQDSAVKAGLLVFLLLFLFFAPIGSQSGYWVPFVGWGEEIVDNFCLRELRKAQNAYLVTVTLDSAISLARSAEAGATFFGVGGTVAPGEILAPAHASIKALSDFYYYMILTLMVAKQAMALLSWLCFKTILPCACLCGLGYMFFKLKCLKLSGIWLCKAALVIWLFLPLAAGLGIMADNLYIAPRYEAQSQRIGQEVAVILDMPATETNGKTISQISEQARQMMEAPEKKGVISKMSGVITNIRRSSLKADDLTGLLLLVFSQTAIVVYIIPSILMLVFYGVAKTAFRSE